jgi:hypothetical protein
MKNSVLNLDVDDEVLAWLRMRAEEGDLTPSEAASAIIIERMRLDVSARISETMVELQRALPRAEFRVALDLPEGEGVIQVFAKVPGSPEQLVVIQFEGGRIEKIGDWSLDQSVSEPHPSAIDGGAVEVSI